MLAALKMSRCVRTAATCILTFVRENVTQGSLARSTLTVGRVRTEASASSGRHSVTPKLIVRMVPMKGKVALGMSDSTSGSQS